MTGIRRERGLRARLRGRSPARPRILAPDQGRAHLSPIAVRSRPGSRKRETPMNNAAAKLAPKALQRIRLHLARSKDFPDGSARHGYEFVAPLGEDGHIDP